MYASQRDRNREREGESQRERKPGREREIERATDNRQQRFSLALSDSLWLYLALSGSCSCIQIPCLAHTALAQLGASLLRFSTLSWSVLNHTIFFLNTLKLLPKEPLVCFVSAGISLASLLIPLSS